MASSPSRIVDMTGAWPSRTPKSPSLPGTTTICTCSERSSFPGVTSSKLRAIVSFLSTAAPDRPPDDPLPARGGEFEPRLDPAAWRSSLLSQLLGLGDRFLDAADHV